MGRKLRGSLRYHGRAGAVPQSHRPEYRAMVLAQGCDGNSRCVALRCAASPRAAEGTQSVRLDAAIRSQNWVARNQNSMGCPKDLRVSWHALRKLKLESLALSRGSVLVFYSRLFHAHSRRQRWTCPECTPSAPNKSSTVRRRVGMPSLIRNLLLTRTTKVLPARLLPPTACRPIADRLPGKTAWQLNLDPQYPLPAQSKTKEPALARTTQRYESTSRVGARPRRR